MKRLTLFMLLLALAMPRAAKAIYFHDSVVKAICVANWDTDGDGELSNDEAAAVTSIGTVFRGNTTITSFSELLYFTSLTSLTCADGYGTFQGCYNLELINLPSSLTTIGKYAFYDCRELNTIEIPSAVTLIDESAFENCWSLHSVTYRDHSNNSQLNTINEGAFHNCYALTSFVIPSGVIEISANTFYNTGLTQIEIPPQVTSIGNNAFYNCASLATVTWYNYVTSIGESAFEGCSGMTWLEIPSSLTSIGVNVFRGCSSLTQLIIPSSVTTIEASAFRNCSGLTSVTIGNNVQSIGDYAFSNCNSLPSVTIPSSVTTLSNNAFYNCSNLTSVTIQSNALASANYGTTITLGSKFGNQVTGYTIGPQVTAIGNYAFYGCSGMTSVAIGNNVQSIGNNAFQGCSGMTSVAIGNSVTSIGNYAFYACTGLNSVTIGNSVTSIGNEAFRGCTSLTATHFMGTIAEWCNISFSHEYSNPLYYSHNLYINDELVTTANWSISGSVTIIKPYAFYGCTGLNSVTIPLSVTSIGNSAFGGCTALTSVTLRSNAVVSATYTSSNNFSTIFGNQVESYTLSGLPSYPIQAIGNYAFYGCSGMTSLDIPNSLTSIGESAFRNCSGLTYFTFPSSVTSIGQYAFRGCSGLNSITIPNSVTSINSYTFYGCSGLTSVTIGNSVTSIGQYAFSGCSGLNSITIPNSVTSIGNYAFSDCTGLTEMTVERTTPPNAAANTFSNVPNTIPIYVPCGTKEAYQATNWNYFTNIVDPCGIITFADANVKSLCVQYWDSNQDGELSYDEAAAVTTLKPQGVTNSVFYNKPNITSFNELQYFTGLTSLAPNAFNYCSSLASVTLPNSVTTIGQYAFNRCTSLVSVSLGNSVVTIDNNAFSYCSQLASVTLPNTVTTIGNFAFENCTSLTAIELPNSLTSIGNRAFNNTSLTSIVIPASVTSLVDNPFRFPSQATITVDENNPVYSSPNNCNAIIKTGTNELVVGCKNSVIPSTVTSIAAYAFYGCNGLTSITIPDAVVSIGDYSFRECTGLTSITFSNTLSSIGTCAFWNCSGLSSITLPSTLASIGSSAFYNCTGLTSITVEASAPPTLDGTTVFNHVNTGIPVIVPCESLETYQTFNNGQPWGGFSNIQCDDCTAELPLSENFDSYPGVTSGSVNVLPDCWSRINTTTVSSQQGYPTITEYNYAQSAPNFLYFMSSYVVGSYEDPQDQYAILPSVDNVSDLVLSLSARIPAGGRNGTFMVGVMTDPTDASTFTSLATFAPTTTTYQQYTLAFNSYSGEGHYIAIKMPAASSDVYYRGLCIDDVTLDIVSSPNIVFADATVKALCVANWDTNGDNELSYAEAAAVTSLGSVFYEESITTFDELQYFTGLEYIDDEAFANCIQLTSVIIPSSVTFIAYESFWNCSSLTSVTISGSVTTIGDEAFYDCSSLTSVTIPGNVTTIGNEAFSGCSSLTSIIIPNGVTTIGYDAFYGCSSLTSVTIPNTVTTMIGNLFPYCPALASITVEAGNTIYDSRDNCNAIIETATNTLIAGCKNTVIPNTVITIGGSAFYGCTGLTSITIPSGVSTIGYSAFNYCNGLTSITIPSTVTSIGSSAFSGCSGLTEMTVEATTPPTLDTYVFQNVPTSIPVYVPCGTKAAYQAAAGWNAFTNIVDPCEAIVFADPAVKALCVANWDTNGDGELSYPEAAAVTDLGNVFQEEPITTFNELQYFTGLIEIEDEAFMGCTQLTSIIIPSSVTTIDSYVFDCCYHLTSITIPSSVTTIIGNPFTNCLALASITVEAGNTVYDSRNGCNAIIHTQTNTLITGCKNTVIPSGIVSIGNSAFYGCKNLTSITFPVSLTSIGKYAFDYCNHLTSVTLPNGVTSIGKYAFEFCTALTSVTLPNGISTLSEGVFNRCSSLASITIPSGVTSIGNYAFAFSGLTSITIPSGVTEIGDYAFRNCTGLTSITVEAADPPTLGNYAFQNVPTSIPVNVPCGTKAAYQNASGWSVFTNFVDPCEAIVFADDNVKALCVQNWDTNGDGELSYPEAAEVTSLNEVFNGNEEITSFNELQYFTGLTSIGEDFYNCNSLESITLPNTITSISGYAFQECASLTSITIPSGVAEIGYNPFANCPALASIIVEAGNTVYDSRDNCNAIIETASDMLITGCKNTVIPSTVTIIGLSAFQGCSDLTSFTIPNGVTTIGQYAFQSCNALASISLPSTLTSIGNYAFNYCSSLTSVTIPSGVTYIGSNAFQYCTALASISIPSTVTSIGNYAFNGCTGLTSITLEAETPPSVSNTAFNNVLNTIPVYVPCGSVGAYQAHNGWQYFNNFIGEGCSQENTLVDGWNWWAPTVAMSLTELETALNGNAILINSQDGGFLRYENGSWSGTLPAIEVGKMYKIMTSAVCTLSVQGNRPAVVTVTLEPGYTWFGYTGTQATSIATALGTFVPATGDMIIGENGTATYTGGTWTGNLTELVPGHGYVYFSTYNNTRTLILR